MRAAEPGQRGPAPRQGPSRRRIVQGTLVAAAAGAAGGSALAQATPSAPATAVTTIEQAALAPAVVMLTDAGTITVDASLGNDFRVTIAASRTMGTPANPANGQQIIFQITQGGAGSCAITWGSGYEFGTGLPQPALSTTAGQTDVLGFIHNAAKGTWLLAAFVHGFTGGDGGNRLVDVEVTPGGGAPPPVNSGAFLAFFP